MPYFRTRLSSDGVVETWMVADGSNMLGDTASYVLSLRRLGKDAPWLRATGQRATLSVVSASDRDRFAVLPLTVARSVRNLSPWTVHAGTYNVALVPDSLYQVCKLPCESADTVKLLPWGKASVEYQGRPPSR